VKVLIWGTNELSQMPLLLIPNILDALDMVTTVGKLPRMFDPGLVEVRYIERDLTGPVVRVTDAICQDHAVYDRR